MGLEGRVLRVLEGGFRDFHLFPRLHLVGERNGCRVVTALAARVLDGAALDDRARGLLVEVEAVPVAVRGRAVCRGEGHVLRGEAPAVLEADAEPRVDLEL